MTRRASRLALAAVVAATVGMAGYGSARAATSYWNPAAPPSATGSWDTVGTNLVWNSAADGTGTNAVWNTGDDAVFSVTGVTGSGTVTLVGALTANSITVNEGPITFAPGTGAGLTLNGGGMSVNATAGTTTTLGAIPITLGAAQTWNVATGNTLAVGGNIQGGALNKSGLGTVVLSGVTTNAGLQGGLGINQGTVRFINNVQTGGAGSATYQVGKTDQTGTLADAATLEIGTTGVVLNRATNLNNNATVLVSGGGTWNAQAFTITNGATVYFQTKTASDQLNMGIQTLGGDANSVVHFGGLGTVYVGNGLGFNGSYQVDGGYLQLRQLNGLGATNAVTVNNGAFLGGQNGGGNTANPITLKNGSTLGVYDSAQYQGGSLTLDTTGSVTFDSDSRPGYTFSAFTVGGSGALAESIAAQGAKLILKGNNSQTINSTITISGNQTIALQGTGTKTLSGTLAIAGGGPANATVTITSNDAGVANALTLNGVSGASNVALVQNVDPAATVYYNSPNTFAGGLIVQAGTAIPTTNTTLGAGTVINGPFGTGTLTLTGGTLKHSAQGSAITIANNVNINGNATILVAQGGNNRNGTFTGTTTFTSGLSILTINNTSGGGNNGNGWTFNNPVINTDFTLAGTTNITSNGDTIALGASGGSITWTAPHQITFTNTATGGGYVTDAISGWLNGSGGALTLMSNPTVPYLGGAGSLYGSGNLAIGTASIASTVKVGVGTNAINGTINLPNFAGNTLDLNNNSFTIAGLTGGGAAGGVVTSSAAGTPSLVIAGTSGSNSFDGVIQNGSSTGTKLVKTGAGEQIFTRNQAFTGTTSVLAGKLTLSSAATLQSSGSPYVVAGGTLVLDNATGGALVDRLKDGQAITLGSLTLSGANGGGVQTETVGALTLTYPGTITVNNGNSGTDQTTLAFGAVTRNAGSAINFVGTNGTLGAGANSPNVTSTAAWGNQNNILPWATVDGTTWAADNGSKSIVAYSGAFTTLAAATSTTQSRQTGAATPGGTAIATNSLNVIADGSGNILDLGNNVVSFGTTTTTPVAILKTGASAYTISATGTGSLRSGTGGAGTELIAHVFGGDLTISAPLNTAIVNIAQGGTGKLILSGTRAATLSGTVGIAGTLELEGSSTTISGNINGPGALIFGNTTSGNTLTLSSANSNFVGGITLGGSNSLTISNSSTLTGAALTSGPLGLGTLTVAGGAGTVIKTDGTSRTVYNSLAINGDFTFSALSGANNLTIDPQSTGSFGSISLSGARTITALGNTLTLTGPIAGSSTPSLNVKGPGTVVLTNNSATNSTMGNLAVGDNSASGSLGGNLQVLGANGQASIGGGAITVNYGGNFQVGQNQAFNPTNTITVNNGGTLTQSNNTVTFGAAAGTLVVNSGATLSATGNNLGTFKIAGNTFPTAGVLLLNNVRPMLLNDAAYPTLTGTMVFSQVSSGSGQGINFGGLNTGAAGQARTISVNSVAGGGGQPQFTGITVNGPLTVAGGGSAAFSNGSPFPGTNVSASLGTLTGTGTVNIAASPLSNIGLSASYTGAAMTLTSGAVYNSGQYTLGSGAVTLNGGTIIGSGGNNGANGYLSQNIQVSANGGTIAWICTGNVNCGIVTSTVTNATSSPGPLTLRGAGAGGGVNYKGDAHAFTGGFVVASYDGTAGAVFGNGSTFTNNNAAGSPVIDTSLGAGALHSILVPGGVNIAFNASTQWTAANLSMFKFDSAGNSILAMWNAPAAGVDLSAGGLNANVRLGLGGSPGGTANTTNYAGPITPNGTSYNFTPGGTLTLSGLNALSGAANKLDVAAGVMAPNATGVMNGTLALAHAQSYGGVTTVEGTVLNSQTGGTVQGVTLSVQNTLTNAATFTIDNGAALNLENQSQYSYSGTTNGSNTITNLANTGSLVVGQTVVGTNIPAGTTIASITNGTTITLSANATASGNKITFTFGGGGTLPAATSITVKGGAVLTNGTGTYTSLNSANRINTAATLILGGNSGGTYASTAGSTQTLASLTIASGSSTINTNATGGLTIGGAYTRNTGGVVSFSTLNTQFTAVSGSVSAGSVGTGLDSILVGAFTGSDFVVAPNAANVAAVATYDTQNSAANWGTTAGHDGNINNGAAFSGTTATGTVSINALKAVSGNNGTITIGTAATDVLSIKSGMILSVPNNSLAINGPGSLTSGNGQDLIFNVQQNTVTVNAPISGGLALTKVGGGALALTNAGNSIGDVYAFGGTINVNASGALGSVVGARTLYVGQGGRLLFNYATTTDNYSNTAIVASPTGGYVSDTAGTGKVVAIGGSVTLNGFLGVGDNGYLSGDLKLTGTVSGPGVIGFGGNGNADTRGTVILTGNNSNWTGGVRSDNGLYGNGGSGAGWLRIAPATTGNNPLGAGSVVNASGNLRGVTFDTTASGSTTFANDFILNQNTILATWGLSNGLGTGTANTTTLSGKIVGTGALVFQGYATDDDHISEMVLSGTLSISGGAFRYSPSFTNNNLPYSYGNGTTVQNFNNGQGGIALGATGYGGTVAASNQGLVEMPSGTNATTGALGFVRFANPNGLMPGAVGPGYVAALHLASDSSVNQTGHFGYLLTSTSSGQTFTLPEGKSFLIGSLGASGGFGQIGGTLGVAHDNDVAANTYTATLIGTPKAAAGQTLAGFGGGDINIHANAATDSQSLSLLARASNDVLNLGVAGSGNAVVFTPTTGDSGATNTMTLMQKRTGATTLNKVGLGTVNFNNVAFTHTDGTAANSTFTVNVNQGTLGINQSLTLNTLNVNNASTATVSAGASSKLLVVNKLTIGGTTDNWTGKLDLNNNDMIIQVPQGQDVNAAYATLVNQLNAGAQGGVWTGTTGVTSSSAANSGYTMGLGAVPNAQLNSFGIGYTTFDGESVDNNSILVKYTLMGDVNLDGTIDSLDYFFIDSAFNNNQIPTNATMTGYINGDFNYDGTIDSADYYFIDSNFNNLNPPPSAAGASPVPEPASLALLGLGALALLKRRK